MSIITTVSLHKSADLLRDACLSLRLVPRDLITSISVTYILRGSDADRRAVGDLAKRLAEEYDLDAQVRCQDRKLTARFLKR